MKKNIKCDICDGLDYSELNVCHICNRNYCEICGDTYSSLNTCELCATYDTDEE